MGFKAQMRSRLPHAQNLLHAGKSWPLWLVSASTGFARQLLAMKAIERTAYYDKQEQFKAQMRSRLPHAQNLFHAGKSWPLWLVSASTGFARHHYGLTPPMTFSFLSEFVALSLLVHP